MAKSDSFFIRASVNTDSTNFVESAIDLGAYVDALGKSVLRIHNIAVTYGSPIGQASIANPNTTAFTGFQLTTQSQTAMVSPTDKSLIASGKLTGSSDGAAALQMLTNDLDVAPQHWTNGYLVGVEQIYLATDSAVANIVSEIGIVLECTSETLSQSAAMALALSQQ